VRRTKFWLGLKLVFGGELDLGTLLIVIVALFALGWAGDAIRECVIAWMPALGRPPGIIVWVLPLLGVVVGFAHWQRKRGILPLRVREGAARPAKAVVMFLSPASEAQGFRSWQMPLAMIRHHLKAGALAKVVLVPSSGKQGTWTLVEMFRRYLVENGCWNEEEVAQRVVVAPGAEQGVNYESAEELSRGLQAAMQTLIDEGLAPDEIVLDITAGQKPCTAVAAILGLGEGWRVQYVSTQTKQVHEYDITLG